MLAANKLVALLPPLDLGGACSFGKTVGTPAGISSGEGARGELATELETLPDSEPVRDPDWLPPPPPAPGGAVSVLLLLSLLLRRLVSELKLGFRLRPCSEDWPPLRVLSEDMEENVEYSESKVLNFLSPSTRVSKSRYSSICWIQRDTRLLIVSLPLAFCTNGWLASSAALGLWSGFRDRHALRKSLKSWLHFSGDGSVGEGEVGIMKMARIGCTSL
mmetsp:Transcript_44531/g.87221  ORF Transcript_44531/g.87221 Transcript_44531/m.87221 type:complete len:218 (-) Transcript_44531:393-1046(-)